MFKSSAVCFTVAALFCGGFSAKAVTFTTLHDFAGSDDGGTPIAPLTSVGDSFYGTTLSGGKFFSGSVFKMLSPNARPATIYSFGGGSDGAEPSGAVVLLSDMRLYGTTQSGGKFGYGTIYALDAATGTKLTIHDFKGSADGGQPVGSLYAVGNMLFGTTSSGGAAGQGVVFKFDVASDTITPLHAFGLGTDGAVPVGSLVQEGVLLYGATSRGGQAGAGTLFTVDPVTGAFTLAYSFAGGTSSGAPTSLLAAPGNFLYGTTSMGASGVGTVFQFEPSSGVAKTLYNFTGLFDGAYPTSLVSVGSTLYGTTQADLVGFGSAQGGGTIFSIDPVTGGERTIYQAPSYIENAEQAGDLGYDFIAPLTPYGGLLYGTASAGGSVGSGTVFTVDPTSFAYTTLHSFTGAAVNAATNSALTSVSGVLMGTSALGGPAGIGEVFRMSRATGAVGTLHVFRKPIPVSQSKTDGVLPHSGLVDVGGVLYGTTSGPNGGTIYRIDPVTKAEAVVYRLSPDSYPANYTGIDPEADLISVGGILYGTANSGYKSLSAGTIFQFDPATGAYQTDYVFGSSPAAYPKGGLLSYGKLLYGSTGSLAAGPVSTVYSFNPASFEVKIVHLFSPAEGLHPYGTLIAAGGLLYGTASTDGKSGFGAVFSVDPATGAETTVHAFTGADGGMPAAGLLLSEHTLFGTTQTGGAGSAGTVFTIDLATRTLTTLHNFTGTSDGGAPQARLTHVGGKIYGTTSTGGANNRGTVFSITP